MTDDPVRAQYEAYPYPARDPADEATRLIEGSPSHPVEIDHYLFSGKRDWSKPFRALVAGGGTGDGLIMLAQKLADIGCPAEITYLDRSEASRAIAEARAAARNLAIRFVSGDVLQAAELGPFDYIDCCGVLHHLPEPDDGFRALADALAPGGGMGLMVYAPLGRSGVYPLQHAFAALLAGLPIEERVQKAHSVLKQIPPAHPFRRNMVLGDHYTSDAGLYDLLLHAQDRAYGIGELLATFQRTGLRLAGMVEEARYRPEMYLPDPAALATVLDGMDPTARMALAENLSGTLKMHVAYVVRADRADAPVASANDPDAVPHLMGIAGPTLAQHVAKHQKIGVRFDGHPASMPVPRASASAIRAIDGRKSLRQIAGSSDWFAFQAMWAPVHRALSGFNILHYSRGARR